MNMGLFRPVILGNPSYFVSKKCVFKTVKHYHLINMRY